MARLKRNAILPQFDQPIGYFNTSPLLVDPTWYRFFEDAWQRTGGFADQVFTIDEELDLVSIEVGNLEIDVGNLEITVSNLEDDVDGLDAFVSILAAAFIDSTDPDNPFAKASFNVEVAASGGNPAILSLTAGDGVSEAIFAADRVALANLGPMEDEYRTALIAQDGRVTVAEFLTVLDDIDTPQSATLLGPSVGVDMLTLWSGDFSDIAAPTIANGDISIGPDGLSIKGERTSYPVRTASPPSITTVSTTGFDWTVLAVLDLTDLADINEISASGTEIMLASPPGTATGSPVLDAFDVAVFMMPSAPSIGSTITYNPASTLSIVQLGVSRLGPVILQFDTPNWTVVRNDSFQQLAESLRPAIAAYRGATRLVLAAQRRTGGSDDITMQVATSTVLRCVVKLNQGA